MDVSLKKLYDQHKKEVKISYSMLESAKSDGKYEGKIEGKIEGKLEGKIEGKIETVLNCNDNGIDIKMTANIASLPEDEVNRILKENGRLKDI
jgi:predicted transposase/invertase (TIGR01784 family)